MSKSVFISHAVKDTAIAKALVDLIEEGIGVPEVEIFCSSVEGYGIPNGENFVTFIKSQMLEPKVVVLLLTPAYFESSFCLSELGAAWIKSHAIFPILVPPLEYSDVKDVLLGTQVAKIGDDLKYNELRDLLAKEMALTPKTQTRWETKRRAYLKIIEPLLEDVSGPSKVPASKLVELNARLAEAQVELDELEDKIVQLQARLAATEALKDSKDVATVHNQFLGVNDDAVLTGLDELTEIVKERLSVLRGNAVKTFALSDHYGTPYTIQRYSAEREDFEEAARRGMFSYDDGDAIIWQASKMKKLRAALKDVDAYVAEHLKALARASETAENDLPTEAETQDFWEYHYDI